MSSRRGLRPGITMGLLAGAALLAPLTAQTPSAGELTQLEARLTEIDARLEALDRAVETREARIEAKLAADLTRTARIEIGPFVVVGPRAEAEEAATGVEAYWARYAPVFGDDPGVPTLTIQVVRSADMTSMVEGDPLTRRMAYYPGRSNARDGTSLARILFEGQLPRVLNSWSAGYGWDREQAVRIGYQAMLESAHPLSLACSQEAEVEACMDFLFVDYDGTRQSIVTGVDAWYPRDQIWPRVPSNLSPGARNSGCVADDWDWVIEEPTRDRASCVQYLAQSLGPSLAPSKAAARGSLLRFALEQTDTQDFTPLDALSEGATVGAQLEALSGVPIEELVAAWRSEMTLGEPGLGIEGGGGGGPFSLLWAGAFTLLALRSTRWRLG